MADGILELVAMCVGLVGLIGAAATTGMPTWKVTAFIGENIVVMESRWEGLWMNCYRQANIRMQCKVYDSLLFLPPELQAARGLMCCSLALSGLGLLAATLGLRCTSCFRGQQKIKSGILSVAGGLQLLASACVFIPVSWTGHVIIRDFYNPLLIDAQRRELGDALYIGWVTGAFLFSSGLLFLCGLRASAKSSEDGYRPAGSRKPVLMESWPVQSLSGHASDPFRQNQTVTGNGVLLNSPESFYGTGTAQHSSLRHLGQIGSIYTPVNSFYSSQSSTPYTLGHNRTVSYPSSFQPAPQAPLFIQYKSSGIQPASYNGGGPNLYI